MKVEFLIEGETHHASLEKKADGYEALINGNRCPFHYEKTATGRFVVEKDGEKFRVMTRTSGERTYVWVNGQTLVLERPISDDTAGVATGSDSHLTAPMPGTLSKLLVEEGQIVEEKQTVAILEAMKMEHNLRAPRAGKVAKIFFKEGDVLEADATVIDLEKLDEDSD